MDEKILPSIITITKIDDERDFQKFITTLKSVAETVGQDEYLEYIVVKSGKYDSPPPDFTSKIKNFRIVQNPDLNAKWSSQRNLGVREARSDYIVFVDDGMRLDKGWLDALKKEITKPDVVAVSAAVLPEKSNSIWGKCQGLLLHPGGGYQLAALGPHEIDFFHTGCCIARKEVLEEFKFDENLNFGCEDMDISIRIKRGYPEKKFIFTPFARAYHHTRDSILEIFLWMKRYGRGRVDIFKKHRIPMPGFFIHKFLIFIAVSFLLSFFSPLLTVLVLLVFYLFYFLKLRRKVLNSVAGFENVDVTVSLVMPIIFWIMNLAFDIGRVQGFVSSSRIKF